MATLTAAALVLPASAAAQPPRHRGPPGGPGPEFNPEMIEKVAAEIGVDEATVRVIKDAIYNANKEAIGIRAELDGARLELQRMMDTDEPNVGNVLRQVDKVGGLETKIKRNRIGLMLSVRGKLNPKQRRQLRDEIRKHRGPEGAGGPWAPGRRGKWGPR